MNPRLFGMKMELDIIFPFVKSLWSRLAFLQTIYHLFNDGEQPSVCPSREIIGR